MTPEEYQRVQRKLTRYGHIFDPNLHQKLPAPLVRTKKGGIAKRQPKYEKKNKTYYQAQCSFRGLKTTGTIEELQALLQARDVAKDEEVRAEMERLDEEVDKHMEEQEDLEDERWWQDPVRTLDQKVAFDALRGLREVMGKGHAIEISCYVFKESCPGIEYAAIACGLVCETVETPPNSGTRSILQCHVVGQPDAVRKCAQEITDMANEARRDREAREHIAREAKKEEKRKRLQAVVDEAKTSSDWDITGTWSVRCKELATFSSRSQPSKLTMTIWQDDYRLDDIRAGAGEEDSEEEYDYYLHEATASKPKAAKEPEKNANIPRFQAKFDFGVVEGVMRIFPGEASRDKKQFSIKDNFKFEYIWRGRETGESEIQTTADEHVEQMTFSEYGTRVEGVFRCEYLKPVRFAGVKVSHGRGQKQSSATAWSELSERAHDRESRSRWDSGWW